MLVTMFYDVGRLPSAGRLNSQLRRSAAFSSDAYLYFLPKCRMSPKFGLDNSFQGLPSLQSVFMPLPLPYCSELTICATYFQTCTSLFDASMPAHRWCEVPGSLLNSMHIIPPIAVFLESTSLLCWHSSLPRWVYITLQGTDRSFASI
jgi:hypothetical protein